MSEKEQKKSGGLVALVVLLLIVTIVSAILATYAWAKYTSSGEGNAVAEVAKWNVTFSDNKSSFTGTYSHVAGTKVAPGTSGSFDITVNPNDTEVSFDYTIKIKDIQLVKVTSSGETVITDNTTVLNLEAADADKVKASDVLEHIIFTDEDDNVLEANTSEITGKYTYNGSSGSFTGSSATKTISWNWEYELKTGSDAQKAKYDHVDTVAGEYAAGVYDNTVTGLKFKINYDIEATQIKPTTPTNPGA